MTISEHLQATREAVPGCQAVVFGDIETLTVLLVQAADDRLQEDHDSLLEEAAFWLRPSLGLFGATEGATTGNGNAVSSAIVVSANHVDAFSRPDENVGEALCLTVEGSPNLEILFQTLEKGFPDNV